MSELAPFRLDPILVERPWGGRRLASHRLTQAEDDPSTGVPIGESWELCDLPQHVAPYVDDPSSRVLDGPFAGERLRTVVNEATEALLGPVEPTSEGRFPLLFKLLDAREHLSVQVHPHEVYVAEHPEARLKTESWYIVEADAGAVLYLDVVPGTTMVDLEAAMGSADVVSLLDRRPAIPGSFHHVPAGLIHALGAGTLLAEVQTPSDTTFRLYDWSVEYRRAPRQLHPVESLGSIVLHPEAAFSLDPSAVPGTRELVRTSHYWMREHRLETGSSGLAPTPGPVILHVVSGAIGVAGHELGESTTAIVPATSRVTAFEGEGAVVLEMGF